MTSAEVTVFPSPLARPSSGQLVLVWGLQSRRALLPQKLVLVKEWEKYRYQSRTEYLEEPLHQLLPCEMQLLQSHFIAFSWELLVSWRGTAGPAGLAAG